MTTEQDVGPIGRKSHTAAEGEEVRASRQPGVENEAGGVSVSPDFTQFYDFDYTTATVSPVLDESMSETVRSYLKKPCESIESLFLAAWTVVVARTNNTDEVAFGQLYQDIPSSVCNDLQRQSSATNAESAQLRLDGLTVAEFMQLTRQKLLTFVCTDKADSLGGNLYINPGQVRFGL